MTVTIEKFGFQWIAFNGLASGALKVDPTYKLKSLGYWLQAHLKHGGAHDKHQRINYLESSTELNIYDSAETGLGKVEIRSISVFLDRKFMDREVALKRQSATTDSRIKDLIESIKENKYLVASLRFGTTRDSPPTYFAFVNNDEVINVFTPRLGEAGLKLSSLDDLFTRYDKLSRRLDVSYLHVRKIVPVTKHATASASTGQASTSASSGAAEKPSSPVYFGPAEFNWTDFVDFGSFDLAGLDEPDSAWVDRIGGDDPDEPPAKRQRLG